MNHRYIILLISWILSTTVFSQRVIHQIESPLRIPLFLSGNFGELRGNHFHSGIDFKTQGTVGKSVYSIDKGYVSRISVSPYGYGNAFYITHPSIGLTSVYAHLNRFSPRIDSLVKTRQYEQESFSVDLKLSPEELPVNKGERVAVSGNTGSSGGPHVHFELRETETETPIDPLAFYRHRIKDTRKPDIRGIALYTLSGKGIANKTGYMPLVVQKNGHKALASSLSAWGDIYLGVKAYDQMDSTTNIYGIYSIQLQVDSVLVYSSSLNRISFQDTRYLNSFIDYEAWANDRSFVMLSYVDEGNKLPVYQQIKNRGIISINEERDYLCVYTLRDIYGNKSELKFTIKGVRQEIPQEVIPENAALMTYDQENIIDQDGIRFELPAGSLYRNLWFEYDYWCDSTYYSNLFHLHNDAVPMHQPANLRIQIANDILPDKSKYCVAKVDGGYATGTYTDGYFDTKIVSFGTYAVSCDTVAPTITPVNPQKWGVNGRIVLRMWDDRTGIQSYRGELDGQFVLFEMDGKTATLNYRFDRSRIEKGKMHQLLFIAVDNCGNETRYEQQIKW